MIVISPLHRRSLKKQIAEMESTLVQPRSWELQGETTASSRKENELLEIDLDVDRVGVSAPVSTVESTLSLEELIKVLVRISSHVETNPRPGLRRSRSQSRASRNRREAACRSVDGEERERPGGDLRGRVHEADAQRGQEERRAGRQETRAGRAVPPHLRGAGSSLQRRLHARSGGEIAERYELGSGIGDGGGLADEREQRVAESARGDLQQRCARAEGKQREGEGGERARATRRRGEKSAW